VDIRVELARFKEALAWSNDPDEIVFGDISIAEEVPVR